MKKKLTVFSSVIFIITALLLLSPAGAITNGVEDTDNEYPWVVLLIMDVGGSPAYRCSGTLISSDTVLTAGHCVNNYPDSPFTGIRIFNEQDVQSDPTYPFPGGPNTIEAVSWASLPGYESAWWAFDAGVVKLSEEVHMDSYPTLPELDSLDALATQRGQQDVTFDAVGYGLQQINPAFFQSNKVRMISHPKLDQINAPGFTGSFSLLLSNNHATGGTCFGDSGGPNFLGGTLVVAGVTSFGMNSNTCGGTGGVFRMDRSNVLDFVNSFL